MKITPEYIASIIDFYPGKPGNSWAYDPMGLDMRNLQARGAARVFNLLEDKKIALLADEVGMGKTIQALSVCAALWNEKPEAKVLILAPRDEIAHNWEREYQTFVKQHYRHNDNIIKSISGNDPIKKMVFSPNLYSLVHELQQGWGQLFIGKISSFSSLMAKKDPVQWLDDLNIKGLTKAKRLLIEKPGSPELNFEIIRLLKEETVRLSKGNRPFFDLIIIDEAHYFRKKDGDSLRVNSAMEFFGNPYSELYKPLASRVLLLTATPNHSSSKDIENIVSYFTKEFTSVPYKKILDTICVRRLRRLSDKGYNKYNYRNEISSPSDFKENPLSEMFFGLYQHELASEVNRTKRDSKPGRGVSRMMKYLEGVEFIPFEKKLQSEEDKSDDSKSISTDYSKGTDAHILLDISKKFQEVFAKEPKHPKYDKLVEDLTLNHNDEKAVIFVRRIPSVFEIAKRIIEYHDTKMWAQLANSGLNGLSYKDLDRKTFKKYSSADEESNQNTGITEGQDEDDGNIPFSKVLNLFKIIKNDSVKSTHASNFRLRFNHSKPNIFALFFSPGEDYFAEPYQGLMSFRFEVGNEQLENYFNSALLHRASKISELSISKDILSNLLPKNAIPNSGEEKEFIIPTLFTIFWEILDSDINISKQQKEIVINTYQSFSIYERESFSVFIEKGSLLASESIIWFYDIFRKIQEEESLGKTYLKFVERVKERLVKTKLYTQIQESILHFKSIYTKVFSINSEKELLDENWDSFNNAQPIYPYNSDNSNQKVLKAFNTPFYPDILVATSVLQEGVNLQYFCNTIYHYGMAWTPGDNEQRIGRIDRMFGKIERLLEKDATSSLNIYYPYLKDTIDEEQLARFTKRKFKEEALIDQGKAFEETAEYALHENDNGSWLQFFRKPELNSLQDPFPAKEEDFIGIVKELKKSKDISLSDYYHSIVNAIAALTEYKSEIFFVDQIENNKLLIDPILNGDRKQPVVIELVYDNIGSGYLGKSVYCLRMRTPLAPYSKYRAVIQKFKNTKAIQGLYLPGVKLCLDPSQTGGTGWGIYMSMELPLFIGDGEIKDNPLSIEEIQHSFVSLIKCADQTEKELFDRDLQKEDLNMPIQKRGIKVDLNFRKSKKQNIFHEWSNLNNYLIKEKEKEVFSFTEADKYALIENHTNLYVKTIQKKDVWIYQVAFLSLDTQKIELQLLEKHLDVVYKNVGW